MTPFVDRLDLGLMRDLLGVGEHESDRAVVRAARSASPPLTQTVISVAARGKTPIGTGSTDELRRARSRAARYASLHEAISAVTPARMLKGSSIARFYPPGLVRAGNDVDLLVPDEVSLWKAARVVGDRAEITSADVSVLCLDGRAHLVLGLSWESEDPLLDRDFRAEISTLALVGDYLRVRPRTTLPDDGALAALVCLAEERFQREFGVRDVLDTLLMFDHHPPGPAEIAATAAEYQRAPELLELLTAALAVHDSPGLAQGVEALREPAATEERRRSAATPDVLPVVDARLAAGLPVYGLPLREARRDWPVSHLHRADGLHLLRTPVGDFLMVATEVVSPQDHEAALRELDALDEEER
ncbi:hypothetical protein ACIRG5_25530 [Lentzea sp. NPDC102401]|uniref:hypothetical protein n=1 Tax=Lentzea sp. NPDC102401 TaxID=3364128 RepID=UPI003823AC95